MTHRLLIDTDPGVDDALAILMASAHPGCRIEALTITAGNVGLGHTLANALKLCEVADIDAPVFPGAPVPLVAVPEDAAYVHGRDGFGDAGLSPPSRRAVYSRMYCTAAGCVSHRSASSVAITCASASFRCVR